MARRATLGCETLSASPPAWLRGARLGLLSNQASVAGDFRHVRDIIREAGGRITALFSPQHGFFGEKQANMVESADAVEPGTGVPVFSLYGAHREPTPGMLRHIDVLVVDLQDVGTRVYTFGATLGLCMEACGRAGVTLVVLDRPNPVGGETVEGNVLAPEYRSFVGRYPLPMRHGLTLGEYARFIAMRCGVACGLEVAPLQGWRRREHFPATGLPWVPPSPNMPTPETALLYPGMVLFEGANVSEGRGTTQPFELFGAPWLDRARLLAAMPRGALEGCALRPATFEPTFDKYRGEACRGFQVHVTDRRAFRPYFFTVALLSAFLRTHGGHFRWLPPPYEYEREALPIDILLGDAAVRGRLEAGEEPGALAASWKPGIEAYRDLRRGVLLYE